MRTKRALVERSSRTPFDEDEAESAAAILERFVADKRNSEQERENAKAQTDRIREALALAKQYREEIAQIQRQIDNRANFRGLINANETLKKLPRITLLSVNAPGVAEIQTAINSAVERYVEEECTALASPPDVTQVGLNEQRLRNMRAELSKAGFSHLEARVQAAARRLQENAQELQKRQSEETIRAEIRGVSPSLSLKELLEKAKWLHQLSGYSAQVMEARNQKEAQVNAEINRLATRVQSLEQEIGAVASARRATDLRDELLTARGRYKDSGHQQVVENGITRLGRLREFFVQVEELSRPSAQTADDLHKAYRQIQESEKEYAGELADSHRAVLAQARAAVDRRIADEEKKALAWLDECREAIRRGGEATRLHQKLNNPPAFLPAESQPELSRLRLLAQERIDSDAILQIEAAFRGLASRQRQEECLRRLVELLEA